MYPYLEYIPAYLREILDYQGIAAAVDPEAQDLEQESRRIYLNQFIDSMDMPTIIRWEKILSLPGSGTIAERRFAIAAKRIRFLPFTEAALRQMLAELCGEDGYTLEIFRDRYLMQVRIALESQNNYNSVRDLLLELKPAMMLLDLHLMYNTYKMLSQFTYRQLSRYTYKELREKRFQFNAYRQLSGYSYAHLANYKYYQLTMEDLENG